MFKVGQKVISLNRLGFYSVLEVKGNVINFPFEVNEKLESIEPGEVLDVYRVVFDPYINTYDVEFMKEDVTNITLINKDEDYFEKNFIDYETYLFNKKMERISQE